MTPAEHAAQVRMVHESTLLADERTDRKEVTRLIRYRPCVGCGEPRSYLACARCDRPAAA